MGTKEVWNKPPVIQNRTQQRLATKVRFTNGRRRPLNAREWKFVQELVANDGEVTMKEAAIRAGYSAKSASIRAWKLTNPEISPHVVAAIQEYRAELAAKYNTTYERHMRDLQTIRDKALAAGAFSAAVQAEYRRGQALGTIYVDRKEIRHGSIDSMSKDEVMRKLEELKRIYGGPPQEILEAEVVDIQGSIERDPPFTGKQALEKMPKLEDIDTPDTPAPDEEDDEDDDDEA